MPPENQAIPWLALLSSMLLACGSAPASSPHGGDTSTGSSADASSEADASTAGSASEAGSSDASTGSTSSGDHHGEDAETSAGPTTGDSGAESTTRAFDESTGLSYDASTDAQASTGDDVASDDALAALRAWLALPWDTRPPLAEEPFATVPLTREDAETARQLLWDDRAQHILSTRQAEVDEKAIEHDGFVLRYDTVELGAEPPGGRSLFISMHGGGSAPAETNDEQWRNQIALAQSYMPEDALWIAPRAPTDDWNMWFKDHIDPLFDRLITNMIVFEGIDPNRVYLNGYSAGGDGVYQLGPRMADRFAGAGMSAGHPNDASPANLRNLPFAIHVGGDDTAFSRNEVAAEWGDMLDALQATDPDGYPHQVEVHPGLPHWMDLADQVSIPFMQSFTRDMGPSRVVWQQPSITQSRFYWLRVPPDQELPETSLEARLEGQTVHLESTGVSELAIRLSDAMLDVDQPIAVTVDGVIVLETSVSRTIAVIGQTLDEREDPAAIYSGEVVVPLEGG